LATHQPKHILFAPLDWGLGHTTRCIPLIRYMQSLGHVPVIAGNASQRTFIEDTFGPIDFIHLEGYNIRYSRWNRIGQAGLLAQMPRILATIKAEHNWLLQVTKERQIDGIISDNRYGLHHPAIPSVILTHQLQVQTGIGDFADRALQKLHYTFLKRFHQTWVVDIPGTPNLGGKLSHPATLPQHNKYIGLLSQFEEMPHNNNAGNHLLILLSGPEPQRTDLARILWQQALQHNGPITFIEGSESATTPPTIPAHINYHKRLTTQQLAPILADADIVTSRSGYSTLMDLIALRKKAIIIPTPGQTEQQYLGKHLHAQGLFYCAPQKGFDLQTALKEATQFPFHSLAIDGEFDGYKTVVEEWINTL
jgi:predicted glycosyltransferase